MLWEDGSFDGENSAQESCDWNRMNTNYSSLQWSVVYHHNTLGQRKHRKACFTIEYIDTMFACEGKHSRVSASDIPIDSGVLDSRSCNLASNGAVVSEFVSYPTTLGGASSAGGGGSAL